MSSLLLIASVTFTLLGTIQAGGVLNALTGSPGPLNCALSNLSCETNLLANLKTPTPNPDLTLTIPQLLTKYGYAVTQLNVTTDDGYILGVFRTYSKTCGTPSKLTPVILTHGLLCNGFAYLTQYGDGNLAMLLANACFDVYILNIRGTSYSLGHKTLKTTDPAYWNFSFHEMGFYDVPATMAAVTATNGAQKMFYVGHSQGTTDFMVAMSLKPELNAKIIQAYLLAPVAYIGHATNLAFTAGAMIAAYTQPALMLTGGTVNQIQAIEKVTGPLGAGCVGPLLSCGVCQNAVFTLFGFDPAQTNASTVGLSLKILDNASTKTLSHLAQLILQSNFCQFNYTLGSTMTNQKAYNQSSPPCYDLSKVTATKVLYSGLNDNLVVPQDAQMTYSKLPAANTQLVTVNGSCWTHADFMLAQEAKKFVYSDILTRMKAAMSSTSG